MEDRVGTCSLCGGPVVMPSMMVHATPHCLSCGAIAKNPHGPVIPMERPRMPRPKHLTWIEDIETAIPDTERGFGDVAAEWHRTHP